MITEADRKLLDYRALWETMYKEAYVTWPWMAEQMAKIEKKAIEGIKRDMEKEKMNTTPIRISDLTFDQMMFHVREDSTLWGKRKHFDEEAGYVFVGGKIQLKRVKINILRVVPITIENINADDWYVEKIPKPYLLFEDALKGYRQGKVMVNNNDDTDRPHFGRRYIKKYITSEEDVAITLKEITSRTWSLEDV
jgi:hypothetical protein